MRVVFAAVAVVLSSAAAGSAVFPARIEGPFGRAAAQVWILPAEGRLRSVAVFGHGWKAAAPSSRFAWVAQFRPWLDHLASRGNAVVVPRYQLGANDSVGPARVSPYRRGLATAFARLQRPRVPVIVAGYSFGASLAFYYGERTQMGTATAPRHRQHLSRRCRPGHVVIPACP
jgi:pimeloyl-ACP methyl ester carboxylesterase